MKIITIIIVLIINVKEKKESTDGNTIIIGQNTAEIIHYRKHAKSKSSLSPLGINVFK